MGEPDMNAFFRQLNDAMAPLDKAKSDRNHYSTKAAERAEAIDELVEALSDLVDGCERQGGGFDAMDELDRASGVLSKYREEGYGFTAAEKKAWRRRMA